MTIEGTVIKVTPEGMYIDVGYKVEGFVPLNEVSMRDPAKALKSYKEGDKVKVRVLKASPENLILSRRSVELSEYRKELANAYKEKKVIKGLVKDYNSGGLIIDLGPFRGFVPKSHIYTGGKKLEEINLEDFLGTELELKILEIKERDNEVILSNKQAVLERIRKMEREFWDEMYEGKILVGQVKNIIDSGVFVKLIETVDGFIPISELSWDRVKHPSDLVKVGDEIQAVVINFDRAKRRVTLSRKALEPDPWLKVTDLFKEGMEVKGKIVRLGRVNAFVRIAYGIEGVLPIAELPEEKRREGEEVEALITSLNPETRRISLSIKKLQEEREKREVREYLSQLAPPKFTIGDIISNR